MRYNARVNFTYYLCQGGYVFVVVCLSVCLLATLRKNSGTDLHEILREGWQWATEQKTKFWLAFRITVWIQIQVFFPIRHYWEIRKVASTDCVATLQYRACTSRHRHSNYGVITSPAQCDCASSNLYRTVRRPAISYCFFSSSTLICLVR